MSSQTRISTKKSSSLPPSKSFKAPPVIQPKAEKKPDAKLPEWKPGGGGATNPVQRLLSRKAVQAKLTIGEPNDRYEQEADRVARDVLQRINSPVSETPQQDTVQRESTKEVKDELQMKPILQRVHAVGGEDAPSDIEAGINRARGGGQPLDAGLQRSMGQAMGADFSGVRVHTDAQSDQLNQSIQAKAFTTGQDVFFRSGEYNPGSKGGQELIAHELTHVVQQNGGVVMQTSTDQTNQISQKLTNRHKAKKGKDSDQYKFFGGQGKDDKAVVKPSEHEEEEENEKLKGKISNYLDPRLSKSFKFKGGRSTVIQRDDKVFHMDDKGVAHDEPQKVFHMDAKGVAHEHPDPQATTSITKLGTPGPNLTAALDPDDFGMCDTETVTPFLNAYKEGSVWRAAVYKFEGHYSKVSQLPSTYTEVTGPGGNTTLKNSRAQIKALHYLGEKGDDWYMVDAVEAHESVHETRLAPALKAVEPEMQKLFTAITVPDGGPVKDKHSAINAIEKLPAYATAVSRLRAIWDAEYVKRIWNDHDTLTPAAEHKVVDPMIARINAFRKTNGKSVVTYP